MNMFLVVACALFFASCLVLGTPRVAIATRKLKERKLYDSVQIGDKFISKVIDSNPFNKQWGDVFVVTDKKMSEDGFVYIKFKFKDGSVSTDSLSYLIEVLHYVPYTGQDKEQ